MIYIILWFSREIPEGMDISDISIDFTANSMMREGRMDQLPSSKTPAMDQKVEREPFRTTKVHYRSCF